MNGAEHNGTGWHTQNGMLRKIEKNPFERIVSSDPKGGNWWLQKEMKFHEEKGILSLDYEI
jgi:hypothetical protein